MEGLSNFALFPLPFSTQMIGVCPHCRSREGETPVAGIWLPRGLLTQVYLHLAQMMHAVIKDNTADELSQCVKRLKHGKSPGNDGILADIIKDGGDLVQQCLLWLFKCMLC